MPVERVVPTYPSPVEHIAIHDYRMRLDLLAELDKGFVRDRSFTWPVMTIGSH